MPRSAPDSPPAIVLGGTANALSVSRSLGSRGIRVFVLCNARRHARYCRYARWVPIAMAESSADYLEWLTGAGVRTAPGGVILPTSDQAVELVARQRAMLARTYRVPYSNDEVLLAMLDKERTYAIARRIGVEAPATWVVSNEQDFDRAAAEVAYPCALKPRHGDRFREHFPALKLFFAPDRDTLRRAFDRTHRLGLDMIVTEVIPGSDDRYASYHTYIDEAGKPLFHLTKRKLRQYPAGFGLGTYHVTDWNPEVAAVGWKFMAGAGVRGIASVELKRDARDERLKLIECNARFIGTNEMLRIAGLDLALLVYNRAVGRPPPPLDRYRRDVYAIVPFQDFLAYRALRRRRELSLAEWLRSLLHRQTFFYWSFRDPKPAIAHGLWTLRDRLRKRFARLLFRAGDGAAAEI